MAFTPEQLKELGRIQRSRRAEQLQQRLRDGTLDLSAPPASRSVGSSPSPAKEVAPGEPTPTDDPSAWEALKRGTSHGVDMTQGMIQYGGAVAADLLEADSFRDSLEKMALDNMMEVERTGAEIGRMFKQNPDTGDFSLSPDSIGDWVNWAAYNFGSGVVTTLPSLLSGGLAGLGVGYAARKALAKKVSQKVRTKLLEKQAKDTAAKAAKAGAATGAFAAGTGMVTGEIYSEILQEEGVREPGVALAFGVLGGALETALPVRLLGNLGLGRRAAQEITEEIAETGWGAAAKRVGTEFGKSTAIEALTEGAQTLVEKGAVSFVRKNMDLFEEPETWIEVLESAAAGGVAGGGMSLPASGINELRLSAEGREQARRDLASDPIEPLAGRNDTDIQTMRPGEPVVVTDKATGKEIKGVIKGTANGGQARYVETVGEGLRRAPVADLQPAQLDKSEVEATRLQRSEKETGVTLEDAQAKELAEEVWDLNEAIPALKEQPGWEIQADGTDATTGFGIDIEGLPAARTTGQNPMDVPAYQARAKAELGKVVAQRAKALALSPEALRKAEVDAAVPMVDRLAAPLATERAAAIERVDAAERASAVRPTGGGEQSAGSAASAVAEKESPAESRAKRTIIGGDNEQVQPTSAAPEVQDVTDAGDMAAVREATEDSPTDAQILSEKYPKGRGNIQGIQFHLETPKGAKRRSKPGAANPWEVTMPYDYGGIEAVTDDKGEPVEGITAETLKAPDGDPVDIAIGPNPESEAVWIIDQQTADTRQWDEPKVLVGYKNKLDALRAYTKSFSDRKGPARIGAVTRTNTAELREWLASGEAKGRPFSEYAADRQRPEQLISQRVADTPVDPRIIAKEEATGDAPTLGAHTQGSVRGERQTLDPAKVPLTPAEKRLFAQYPEYPDLEATVRAIKADHPAKVWQPLVFVGIEKGEKAGAYKPLFRTIPYDFHLDSKGERLVDSKAGGPRRARAITRYVNKIVKEVEGLRSKAEAGDRKAKVQLRQAGWYENMVNRLREVFGGKALLYADLLGALSPNTPVGTNWKFAIDALQRFERGEYDAILEEYDAWLRSGKSMDQWKKAKKPLVMRADDKGAPKKFGINSGNVQNALLGIWREVKPLSGPKARNFAANLIGISRRPPIDVWAARYMQRIAGKKPIPSRAEGGVAGKFSDAKAQRALTSEERLERGEIGGSYGFAAEVFTKAAEKLGMQPDNLQAVVWFAEKNYWLETLGVQTKEGGSFEEELDLAPLRRLIAGVSITRPGRPTTKGRARAEMNMLRWQVLRDSPQANKVVGFKFEPTYGRYDGDVEVSFDAELTVAEDYDDTEFVRQLARIGKRADQDDVFVSRVLREGEHSANSRPGFEVHFKSAREFEKVQTLLDDIVARGADGFTLSTDTKWRPEGKVSETPTKFFGVRLQVVPEIAARYNYELRKWMQEGDSRRINQWMEDQSDKFDDILNSLLDQTDIIYAARHEYDTLVMGKETYDDYTHLEGAPGGVDGAAAEAPWFGRPIGEVVRAFTRNVQRGRDERARRLRAERSATGRRRGEAQSTERLVGLSQKHLERNRETLLKLFSEESLGFDHTQWRAEPSPRGLARVAGMRKRVVSRTESSFSDEDWRALAAAVEDVADLHPAMGRAVDALQSFTKLDLNATLAGYMPETKRLGVSGELVRAAREDVPGARTALVSTLAHELTHVADFTEYDSPPPPTGNLGVLTSRMAQKPQRQSVMATSSLLAIGDHLRPEGARKASALEDASPLFERFIAYYDSLDAGAGLKRFLRYPLSEMNTLKEKAPADRQYAHRYMRYELFAQMMSLHLLAPDILARIDSNLAEVFDYALQDYAGNGSLEETRALVDEASDAARPERDRARNSKARDAFRRWSGRGAPAGPVAQRGADDRETTSALPTQPVGEAVPPVPVDRPARGGFRPGLGDPLRLGDLDDPIRATYGRFGTLDLGVDTSESLKIYNLDPLVRDPTILENWLARIGVQVEMFSFDPERFRIPRLKKLNYQSNPPTVWIYDPHVEHGSFNDARYTYAWRVVHEVAHGLTERFMQDKYGDSRREGRLGRTSMSQRGAPPRQIDVEVRGLTLKEAQRAIEGEDVSFRTQRMLFEQLGVTATDEEFAAEYNTNIADVLHRTVTGDFGDPGEVGFLPNAELPNLRTVLRNLQDFERSVAKSAGREPAEGVDLRTWTPVSDADLEARLPSPGEQFIAQRVAAEERAPSWAENAYQRVMDNVYSWPERSTAKRYLARLSNALPDHEALEFLQWTGIPAALKRMGRETMTRDDLLALLREHSLHIDEPYVYEGRPDPEDVRFMGLEHPDTARAYHEFEVITADQERVHVVGTVHTTDAGDQVLYLDNTEGYRAAQPAALARRLVAYAKSAGLDGVAERAPGYLASAGPVAGIKRKTVDSPVSPLLVREEIRDQWVVLAAPLQRGEAAWTPHVHQDNRSEIVRDIEGIVREMTGGRARLLAEDNPAPLFTSRAREEAVDPEAAARAGYLVDAVGASIRVALGDASYDPHSATFQAVWEWMSRPKVGFLTDREQESLTTEAARERLAALAARALGISTAEAADLADVRLQSAAFAQWQQDKRIKETRTFVPRAIHAIFMKVRKLWLRVKSALLRRNYRGVSEVFDAVGLGLVNKPAGFRELHRDMVARVGSGTATIESNLYGAEETLGDFWRGFARRPSWHAAWDKVRWFLQDQYLPVLRRQQLLEAQAGRALSDDEDFYLALSAFPGRVAESKEQLDELMERVATAVKDSSLALADVEDYLYAKHAIERNRRIAQINPVFPDGGSGISTEVARRILDKAESEGTKEALDHIAALTQEVVRFDTRNRFENGLIDKAQMKAWRAYNWYVPLKGWREVEPSSGDFLVAEKRSEALSRVSSGSGRGFDVRAPESRRATGRSSEAGNLLANLHLQAMEGVVRGEKNRALQSLRKFAEMTVAEVNGGGQLFSVNTTRRVPVFNTSTGLVHYRTDTRLDPEVEDRTVRLKVDGEEVRVTMHGDIRIAQAVKNSEVSQVNLLTRTMGRYTRWISWVNTTLNPEFAITNYLRDIQGAGITSNQFDMRGLSREIFRDSLKIARTIPAAYRYVQRKEAPREGSPLREWYDYMSRYSKAGGRIFFYRLNDLESTQKDFERQIRELKTASSKTDAAFAALRAVGGWVEGANLAVDASIRLATFKALVNRGMTDARAADAARNITVDFNRRGLLGPSLNSIYVFFNASVQGTAVVFKAASRSKTVRRALGSLVVAGFVMDLLNSFLSPEDEDGEDVYDKERAWLKETNMLFYNPFAENPRDVYVSIPMPYGYNVFYNFGRTASAVASGRMSVAEALGSNLRALATSFAPIPPSLIPTAVEPFAQAAANENFFGGPIQPKKWPGDQTPDSANFYDNASALSQWIARKLNKLAGGDEFRAPPEDFTALDISPETLDHLAGFQFGAAGGFWMRIADQLTELMGGERARENRSIEATDAPFVRKIAKRYNPSINKSLFYQRVAEIGAAEQEIEALKESAAAGRPENMALAVEKQSEYATLLSLSPMAKGMRKILSRIRTQRTDLRLDFRERGTIDADTFYAKIEELSAKEQEALTRFNTAYFERVKAPTQGWVFGSMMRDAGAEEWAVRDALVSGDPGELDRVLEGSGADLTSTELAQAARLAGRPALAEIIEQAPPGAGFEVSSKPALP